MVDMEKADVILKEFERFIQEYKVEYTNYSEAVLDATHALLIELLKAQEPQKPQIIHCRDCKSYNTTGCVDGYGWCERYNYGITDEWYCGNAKRREDDDWQGEDH